MIDLRQGDCLQLMKEIPDESIDLLITDPPFLYVKGGCKNRYINKQISEELGNFGEKEIFEFLDLAKKKLKKINIYCFCSRLQLPIYFKWIEQNKKKFDLLIWDKCKIDIKTSKNYCNDIEYIIRIYESGVSLNKITKYNNIVDSSYYCKLQKYPQPKLKQHPTPKPIDLIEKYIILSTKENDIVLDPFMGSGSTGIACVKTNRNFIGIELDENYFNIAKERILGNKKIRWIDLKK